MPSVKFDWFQTESQVTLTILKRGVDISQCSANLSSSNVLVVRVTGDEVWSGELSGPVDASKFTVKCTPSKIEISMPKASPGRWASLLSEKVQQPTQSKTKKDWDAIEKEAVREEEEEKPEGDAAVHKMFQKLYAEASDDVKKAMMKSYSESNGTVLSTNWADIGSKRTETKPPDSMEFKKWEQ